MREQKPFNVIGFLIGLLTIAFVVLKLCSVVTWSWVWVLSPLWIYIGLIVIIVAGVAIISWITKDKF